MLELSRLQYLTTYDPLTGLFINNFTRRGIKAGVVMGRQDTHGHVQISVDGVRYAAHKLAWFYHYSEWLVFGPDHKNRIYSDNRIINLRKITNSSNTMNSGLRSDNKSGYKGVYADKYGKFIARIRLNGKGIHLGYFNSPLDAARCYDEAASRLFGEYAQTNAMLGLLS